jgi:hypothetical protein
VATATAAVGIALLVLGQRRLQDPLLLIFAGVGCLVELVALTYIFAGSDTPSRVRFEAPSTLACGLLLLETLWPRRHRPATSAPAPLGGVDWDALLARLAPRWRQGRRRARLVGSVTVLAMVGMAVALFGFGPASRLRDAKTDIERGYHVLAGSAGFVNQYAGDEAEYRRLNALIPAGARVLAAVDQPALLDFSRYSFATLDIPGFVSPPPHMPYFRGAAPKVAYLRGLGYDYIVTQSPAVVGLYYQAQWVNELRLQGYFFRAWAPYFLDWQQSMDQLEASPRYQIRSTGDLTLIRIGHPPGGPTASPS